MLPRYDQSEQVANALTSAGLQFIADKIETRGPANAIPVMVFNPGPGPRTEVVEVETLAPFQRLRVTDDAGATIPFEARLAEAEEIYRADLDREGMREMMAQAGDGHIAGYTISELAVAHDEGSAMATVLTTLLETGEPDMEKLAADQRQTGHNSLKRDDITHLSRGGAHGPAGGDPAARARCACVWLARLSCRSGG